MARMSIRSERSVRFALITNCAILYEHLINMRRCSHGAVRRVGQTPNDVNAPQGRGYSMAAAFMKCASTVGSGP
jgi:hypothetical protein